MTTQKWIVSGLATALLASTALAKDYTFKELSAFDYTKTEKLVRDTLGKNTIDDVEREPKVRAALKLVLSRRNSDNKRSALFSVLQGQLPEPFFLLSLQRVAEGAASVIKDEKMDKPTRATAVLVLENMIAEVQPRVEDYRGILEAIEKSKIEISGDLAKYRRLEGMDTNASPSERAAILLKTADKKSEIVHVSKKESGEQIVSKGTTPDFE